MDILQMLNAPTAQERLDNLERLLRTETKKPDVSDVFVNNHIHTTYSFSPYSPTAAVWFARAATLPTAGIVDHDSIAGAREFLRAGELAGVATTVGTECRVHLRGTGLEDRYINNTDQKGIAYVALHGVPHGQIDTVQAFFAPLRAKRNERNRKMTDNISALLSPQAADGGSVTERHLIFALAKRIIAVCGRERVAPFVEQALSVPLSDKQRAMLTSPDNPYFAYDLLGVLKSTFVERIYVDADAECVSLAEIAAFSKQIDALLCYAYLGDVQTSVTGDKRSGKFEDGYLEELFAVLHKHGVDGITYMPSRNTPAQLKRVRALCERDGFLQISGEDVNSPRQSFVCPQLADPVFRNLVDATWALIRRERERS